MAEHNINYSKKITSLLDEMPDFVSDYIFNFGKSKNPATMLQYSRDILDFLSFVAKELPHEDSKEVKDLTMVDISKLSSADIERYLRNTGNTRDRRYTKNRSDILEISRIPMQHNVSTIRRLRATLSSMFGFFLANGKLSSNPVTATKPQRLPEKDLIYLTNAEQKRLLSTVRTGDNLEGKAAALHERYVLRDLAMILLLLDTGLRVSEILTTDIGDYDFDKCCVLIAKAGGKKHIVYFSDECAMYLEDYFDSQKDIFGADEYLPAFTTLKGERLGVRATQNLVKKYAIASLGNSKGRTITPHKLRSSFAMSFYEASGKDIALLQAKLHHRSMISTGVYAKASPSKESETRNILLSFR